MYEVFSTKQFKKSSKKLESQRNFDRVKFQEILDMLMEGKSLPVRYKDHQLQGDLNSYRECHLGYDLLVMYQINHHERWVKFVKIGTHADLFD